MRTRKGRTPWSYTLICPRISGPGYSWIRLLGACVLLLGGAARLSYAQPPAELANILRTNAGLSEREIESVSRGVPIAKLLRSDEPEQVYVFGAVYVQARSERYVRVAMDVDRLRRLPEYLGVGKFSQPPSLSDLAGFRLEDQDLTSLRSCKVGSCDVQVPAEAINVFRDSIDWNAPNVQERVNTEAQRMALVAIERYSMGGNEALGPYNDQSRPLDIAATFEALLNKARALPVSLPDLNNYLLHFPHVSLPNSESLFYWERVNFGLKPTLRLNHAVSYRMDSPFGEIRAVAVKQLYASHYFQVALDLTVCVEDTKRGGFYLVSLKGSRQAGLTGFRGTIIRKVVTSKARSGLESALGSIKRILENNQEF